MSLASENKSKNVKKFCECIAVKWLNDELTLKEAYECIAIKYGLSYIMAEKFLFLAGERLTSSKE